jgi:diadenylate cyclase
MIGFLFVAAILYLADFFMLAGVSWVLTSIFKSIVIVVVILFQADFRNALARIGTTPLFRDTKEKVEKDSLVQIFSVCEHLSRLRVGALIVVEKEIGLRNYYSDATRLDAKFSPRLLVTLFNPHGPLHDGAVIIDKSKRISYAGCILPLSSQHDFTESLGTRHRAALGLCEETDAVILIVSEENGEISVAHKGELFRGTEDNSVKNKFLELN